MPVILRDGEMLINCPNCFDSYTCSNDLDAVIWAEKHWLTVECDPRHLIVDRQSSFDFAPVKQR